MINIWASSPSPAASFPEVFSDQNWCVLGNGNSRRGSHHPAVNTSPHIWTSGEHERPRGWYLKIQVWTKISIKHKPLKLSVYMWICMISFSISHLLSDPPSTNLTLVPHSPNQLIHYWARRAKCTRSSYTFTDSYKMASKDQIYTFRIGTASGWKLFQWPSSRVSEAHSVTQRHLSLLGFHHTSNQPGCWNWIT